MKLRLKNASTSEISSVVKSSEPPLVSIGSICMQKRRKPLGTCSSSTVKAVSVLDMITTTQH